MEGIYENSRDWLPNRTLSIKDCIARVRPASNSRLKCINDFLQRDLSWQPLPSFRHVHRLCFTKMTMIYVGALIMLWVVAVISDPMKRN